MFEDTVFRMAATADAWRATRATRTGIEARQRRRLARMLGFVRRQSRFYRCHYAPIPDGETDLRAFPPVTKETLLANFEDVVTDTALTAARPLLSPARQSAVMTDLRYLPDADDVTAFEATVTEATEEYVVLDGTYFYPEGGGQPADRGRLSWDGGAATVRDVRKNHGDVRHYVEDIEGVVPDAGTTVTGEIDAERRARLRRMHTAQHVVSRVVLDEFDAATAGNQIHVDRSRIDFEPADFDAEDVATIEREANRLVDADLPVAKAERPRAEVEAETPDGRTQLDLIPDHVDPLRVVEIAEFDTCPCGGTHVDHTGEIGRIRVTDRASKGTDVERIEFELVD